MVVLIAALATGCGPDMEQQANQFAENFVQEYVTDMESELESAWYQLNVDVSYESCTKKECEKEIELNADEAVDYTYYYKIEYTSDNIDGKYERLTGLYDIKNFTSLMQILRRAKSDVYSRYHVWSYYDNVQKEMTTRVYILDQQSERIFAIYGTDHKHCYELRPYDDGDQLYVDGQLIYNDDYWVRLENQETESNTTNSSGSSKNKNPYSGYGNSSRPNYTYSDPYDTKDYDNADDFAEDWADEFEDGNYDDGYDDAYDYWEDTED